MIPNPADWFGKTDRSSPGIVPASALISRIPYEMVTWPLDRDHDLMPLAYYSIVSDECTADDLKSILEISRVKNAMVGVTGALCMNNKYFFQVLEGCGQRVNEIFHSLWKDRRHHNVNIVISEQIAERQFAAWSMSFIGDDALSKEVCRRFCGEDAFRPDRMDSQASRAFLRFLRYASVGSSADDGAPIA